MHSKDKLSLQTQTQTQMMYSTPFLRRVLGLLGLLLGLLGLLSVCSLKAQIHFATNSGRPNFARLCAFRLVNLAKGLLVCAAGEVNFAVCVRQARSHLCLLVVVHCKVVSTLDKKKHQIPPDQAKVTARRSAGHHPRQEERAPSRLAAIAICLQPGDLAR